MVWLTDAVVGSNPMELKLYGKIPKLNTLKKVFLQNVTKNQNSQNTLIEKKSIHAFLLLGSVFFFNLKLFCEHQCGWKNPI